MRQICHPLMHKCWARAKCQWEVDSCGHFVFLVIWMSCNIWPQRCRRVHGFYFRIQAKFLVRVKWRFPKLPNVRGEVKVPFVKDNIPWPAAFPWSIPELDDVFLIHRHLQNKFQIWRRKTANSPEYTRRLLKLSGQSERLSSASEHNCSPRFDVGWISQDPETERRRYVCKFAYVQSGQSRYSGAWSHLSTYILTIVKFIQNLYNSFIPTCEPSNISSFTFQRKIWYLNKHNLISWYLFSWLQFFGFPLSFVSHS